MFLGSIPERVNLPDGTVKYYNTCTVWSPEGQLLVKYRKVDTSSSQFDSPMSLLFPYKFLSLCPKLLTSF